VKNGSHLVQLASPSPTTPLTSLLHYGTKAELGVCGEGANWAENGAPYILIFTSILSHMEHVKTLNGRCLLNESFIQTICMKNVYFQVANTT
jgi:hypothetical protein